MIICGRGKIHVRSPRRRGSWNIRSSWTARFSSGSGSPPELVDAATSREWVLRASDPEAQVFFTSMDEVAWIMLHTIDQQIIRPLVKLNFLGTVGYEILPESLAKLVAAGPQQRGIAPTTAVAGQQPPRTRDCGTGP